MAKLVLFYGQYKYDRKRQILSQGTFFGGAGDDVKKLKELAQEIVKKHRDLIILPKAFRVKDRTIDDIAIDAEEYFENAKEVMENSRL